MEADYTLAFACPQRKIWVSSDVISIWRKYRQIDKHAPESCGVLVGSSSADKSEVWVDHATIPSKEDKQSRFKFELLDPSHQQFVDQCFKASQGTSIYLGTWHTHPEPDPTPSGVDRKDWKRCLKRNPKRPLLFVIVGTETPSAFIFHRRGLKKLPTTSEVFP